MCNSIVHVLKSKVYVGHREIDKSYKSIRTQNTRKSIQSRVNLFGVKSFPWKLLFVCIQFSK